MKTMKFSIVVVVATLFNTVYSYGQNFIYPIGQNLVETAQYDNYESYQIDINTPTSEPIHYNWELISNTFPTGWSYSLCDYGNCAIGVPPTGSMTPITQQDADNGVIGWFKLNLTVAQYFGQGKVEIYVYDSNDYSRGDTVSWDITWNGSTLSINNLEHNVVSLVPNPAENILKIETTQDYNVYFYNGLGQQVMNYNTIASKTIDVSTLENGIYNLVFIGDDGKTFNKRLVIQ